jgi:hypothetical protein
MRYALTGCFVRYCDGAFARARARRRALRVSVAAAAGANFTTILYSYVRFKDL